MRLPALLLMMALLPLSSQAQDKTSPGSNAYGPAQVLSVMRLLREQRGEVSSSRLLACLRNSADNRWSDLQAHFYCWLKPDQRACFTGAVDGELIDHPELKGNYDLAFTHCLQAKGRAFAINFDRPLARLTVEEGEVFKNLLYRRPAFSKDEQRKILEVFYGGLIPERKAFPVPVPRPAPAALAAATPQVQLAARKTPGSLAADAGRSSVPPAGSSKADEAEAGMEQVEKDAAMGDPDFDDVQSVNDNKFYPLPCTIKSPGTRARQKPDTASPVIATLDANAIKVTGPAQASTGKDVMQWYPIECSYRGKVLRAWLPVSQVDCGK